MAWEVQENLQARLKPIPSIPDKVGEETIIMSANNIRDLFFNIVRLCAVGGILSVAFNVASVLSVL
jgi:hypothetical protein